jgi:hypothetical protein
MEKERDILLWRRPDALQRHQAGDALSPSQLNGTITRIRQHSMERDTAQMNSQLYVCLSTIPAIPGAILVAIAPAVPHRPVDQV